MTLALAEGLVNALPKVLKSSYDKLTKTGLRTVEDGNVIKLFNSKNNLVAEITNNQLRFKYAGWGKDIIPKPDKTTTCIAKFFDIVDEPGSNWIKNNLPEGTFGRGASNKNGINILDIDDDTFNALEVIGKKNLVSRGIKNPTKQQIIDEANEIFWNKYNLPFLEQAFARGDDIRLLSNPETLFGSTGFYQREIEAILYGWTKTDGTLVKPLIKKYGYKFNQRTKTYEKIN